MIPGFSSSASMNLIFVEFNLYAYIGWIARDPMPLYLVQQYSLQPQLRFMFNTN